MAGPKVRDLLREIVDPAEDLSNEGFPFMGVREVALLGGVRARLFRISFSGEMAFEISIPARFGDALVRNLMLAGKPFGVTPYGTEALGVMRIEKGHVAGPELNGTTTAGDLGLGRMMSTKKDFIGRALSARGALNDPERQVVVGVKPIDRARRLRSGALVIPKGASPSPKSDQGYVTSACFSPMFDQWIGLGLVARGRERVGEIVRAHDPLRGEDIDIEICSSVFYDPEGGRQRG
jgi:sarcosine oxidase subunit alpha